MPLIRFPRRALDLWGSQDSSLHDGPTLFQPSYKPFHLRHVPQHSEIVSMHADSQVFSVLWGLHGDLRPRANSIDPTKRLAISAPSTWRRLSCHTSLFEKRNPSTSGLRNSCGYSTAIRLRAGVMTCARFTSMNKRQWILDDFLNTPSRQGTCLCTPNRQLEQLGGSIAAKNSATNDPLGRERLSLATCRLQ